MLSGIGAERSPYFFCPNCEQTVAHPVKASALRQVYAIQLDARPFTPARMWRSTTCSAPAVL